MSKPNKKVNRQLKKVSKRLSKVKMTETSKKLYMLDLRREVARQRLRRQAVEISYRADRFKRYSAKTGRFFAIGLLNLIVPLLVFVFICRMMFAEGDININVNNLFMDVLNRFGNSTWSADFLMDVLGNFNDISQWSVNYSGIIETLITIAEVIVTLGNVILLIVALIVQAGRLIGFVFSVLFIS